MNTTATDPKRVSGNVFIRTLREIAYLITGVPILALLFAFVSWALSGGLFIPLALLLLLALLTVMEPVARFELNRANWILGTKFEMSSASWLKHEYFSWEGVKERIVSFRSWLAIVYVIAAFWLSIFWLILASLGIASLGVILVKIGLITVNTWNGSFEVNDWTFFWFGDSHDNFVGNIDIDVNSQNISVDFLDMNRGLDALPSNFTWTYSSTASVTAAVIVLILAIISVPAITSWMRELVLRFLSAQSFAELYYASPARQAKKVLEGSAQARGETHGSWGGLQSSLEALGSKQEFAVDIDARIERLSPELESAVLQISTDAMSIIGQKSDATRMSINIDRKDKLVSVDIEDNGTGGAAISQSAAVKSMKQRTDALGGEFVVMSPKSGPNRFKAIFPYG